MLSIELPVTLEKQIWRVIEDSYHGDVQTAMSAFLWLHQKYGSKEQLFRDIQSVRAEVKKGGGITQKEIDQAIKQYRQTVANGGARA